MKYPTPSPGPGYRTFSDLELLEYIVRSLQGYMKEEEKAFIADKANIPSDIPQIDPSGFYLTASQIRGYIRDWRNERRHASRETL